MEKKYFIPLIFVFLLMIPQIGKASWGLKIGPNYSYLKKPTYSEPGINVMYGISKDWSIYRWIKFRTEILISSSSTFLKEKSVQSGCDVYEVFHSFPHLPDETTGFTDINYYNIDIKLGYLEIPLLVKFENLLRKNLIIGFETGYSFKFRIRDGSNTTFIRTIKSTELTPDEQQNFHFDYRFTKTNEDYSYHGRGLCPNFGLYLNYRKLQIGLRYQVDYIDWVSSVVIGEDVQFQILNLSMEYHY